MGQENGSYAGSKSAKSCILNRTGKLKRPSRFKFLIMNPLNLQCCPVCGAQNFECYDVLASDLIGEWGLNPDEVRYINEQQGTVCTQCRNNLRTMTLASAIMQRVGVQGTFDEFMRTSGYAQNGSILEINAAGALTPMLRGCPRHLMVTYPDVDMMDLHRFADESFDLVIHSDTLEHVPDPVAGLRECRRVLKSGGILAVTVPMVVGRMSRRRNGLPPSYHDRPDPSREGFLVVTEYGADVWCEFMQAGFAQVSLHALSYPQSVAIIGVK